MSTMHAERHVDCIAECEVLEVPCLLNSVQGCNYMLCRDLGARGVCDKLSRQLPVERVVK
jgi:hypothetical protein